MRRGIVAFLVLLAFLPSAIHAVNLYHKEISGIRETKELFLEQQAITVKEQDFEESFWRVVEYTAAKNAEVKKTDFDDWLKKMNEKNISVWYGDSGGSDYLKKLDNPPNSFEPDIWVSKWGEKVVGVQGSHDDAIGAIITVGGSKGIFLIPKGAEYAYT